MILGTKEIKYIKASLFDRIFHGKWKYTQIGESHFVLNIFLKNDIETEFIKLSKYGILTLRDKYSCDGASGPTYDSKSSMRGAFVHDALYQLMRLGLLPQSIKERADLIFYELCLQDGMIKQRAWVWHKAVSIFGFMSCRKGK